MSRGKEKGKREKEERIEEERGQDGGSETRE